MKKLIITTLILGQIIMASTVEYIETNGLKIPVIFENDKRLPLVTMQFTFTNSGSITDTTKAGLAKISAKLMNEGTKTLGSTAFATELESRAISIGASTGTETFVMELSCLKDEFQTGLNQLNSLLKEPNFTKKTVEKIKTMTIGGLSRKENDFDYIASNELKSLMFGDTVLGQPSSGTVESVKSIELNDVKGFINSHLVASRLIVVLGGDIDLAEAKKSITELINTLPKGTSESVKYYDTEKKHKQSILKRETEQAYVYFGSPYNMKSDDKDYYKARIATFILGTGGFGSRLMEEVRVKRGLAYSAYARVSVTKSSSSFTGYLQTKIESLEEAQKTVNEVIADFVKNGVTKEELEQTKKFILGSEPLRVETMSQRLNRTFMEFYNGKKLGSSAKELEKIKNLTLKELNKFIKEHDEINNLSYAIVTQ